MSKKITRERVSASIPTTLKKKLKKYSKDKSIAMTDIIEALLSKFLRGN
jgi:hypothetical protein